MIDLTEKYGTKDKLLVGLANPSIEAVKETMSRDKK
jgi:hypothetical protein